MQPVYDTRLPQGASLGMVDRLLNPSFVFTGSGSGWIVDRIVQLDVNFASINTIRGSSSLRTPEKSNRRICF